MKTFRKLFLLGLTIVLFTACQKNEPQRYFSSSPEIDAVKALIKDYEDANWEKWITQYADTAKIYHNSLKSVSPTELEKGFKETLTDFSSYKFSDDDIFYEMIIDDKGEKWVYFWGTWEGILAANGKQITVPVHLASRFANGKIVREFAYYDNVPVMLAINEIKAAKMAEEEATE
jgi:hypothetical protein